MQKDVIHHHAKANRQITTRRKEKEFGQGPCPWNVPWADVGQVDLSQLSSSEIQWGEPENGIQRE